MKITSTLVLSLILALLLPTVAAANELDEVKSRIKDRFDATMAIKRAGLAGENNVGLLEARGSLSAEQRQVVNAENKDRERLYELLAQSGDSSPSQVARYFARENAKRQPAGVWIQQTNGQWVQK